jgi:signal transduction histidine kinase
MLDFVRKNLDLLNAALDAMPEKVLVLDHTGRVVLTNAAWRSTCQAEPRGAAAFGPGETLRSLDLLNSADEDTAAFLADVDAVVIGRAAACTHVCRSAGAGTARWYRLHATRIHLGRWTGVVVTMDDVSDVHRAKQAISRLSLRLNRVRQQERERIALELHDSTAQHLAAASLNLAGLRARVSLSGRDAVVLDDIERSLQDALHEVQVMSFGLYPPRLDDGDLNAALERFLRTYARQTGIRTELHAPALDSLPPKLQQTLLRITQEALTNVHRHACASRASVRLRITRESVLLCVADNGKGMDPISLADVATAGTGIGISGMQARVDQFGGALRVKSRHRHGTRILAQVPLPRTRNGSRLRALLPSWLHAGTNRRKRRDARAFSAKVS